MSGRPVHLLTAAALAAAASLLPVSSASANCFSGCGGYGYAAPVAYYTAPVVYSYSYAAPVSYAAPCANPCGYASYGYAAPSPMYVVNQGPTFNAPVTGVAEDVYEPGYRRAYPYYGEGGLRWHRRHWHRGYGHRSYGYRSYGYRAHAYRDYGYRAYGARSFGYRSGWRARHYVGPRAMWRGGMHRMHGPRMGMYGPRMHGRHHMNMHRMPMHGPRMHMNRMPGVVHPK